jgi:hypothetical protein
VPNTTTDLVLIVVGCILGAYLLIGIGIVAYIFFFRGPVWSRSQAPGMLWERRHQKRNTNWWFLALTTGHPIGLLLNILFWPLWLLSYWDAKEAEEEAPPRYHGPTKLDDDALRHDQV